MHFGSVQMFATSTLRQSAEPAESRSCVLDELLFECPLPLHREFHGILQARHMDRNQRNKIRKLYQIYTQE